MTQPKASQRYVALLRGINVGGKNMLPMKDLIEIFQKSGCKQVSTFIQSGNVLFTAGAEAESTLPGEVSRQIEAGFGYRIPVMLRVAAELGALLADNPFLGATQVGSLPLEKALHVYFLQAAPSKERIAALDAGRSLPDTFAVRGREIYLNLPNGMARTKLTNTYFDSKLETVSTARNWNTVQTLFNLLKG